MDVVLRRTLTWRWVRGLIGIGVVLLMPMFYSKLIDVIDPQRERAEMSRAMEREQRAGGVPFVTATGERRRAVVYTSARPAYNDGSRNLVWWSRIIALMVALGLLSGTWELLRERRRRGERAA